jgi:hypothetical protein
MTISLQGGNHRETATMSDIARLHPTSSETVAPETIAWQRIHSASTVAVCECMFKNTENVKSQLEVLTALGRFVLEHWLIVVMDSQIYAFL